MRPVRLELVGFSAFREPAVVDFTGTDLVAFVGPTGSGKSSLIDAMTFALYGSVSRYDDARLVEPVIHKLATEARVRLDFEVDGVAHTAVRVVRRTKAGASTKEARLVRAAADDGGAEVILAGAAPEMGRAVQALLGLDFDQFTRTVVLPQGQFATFLREDKGKRQQLLRQLLDVGVYERMGKLARQRAAEADATAKALAEQRDRRPAVTDDELARLAERATGLVALQGTVAARLERIAVLAQDVDAAKATRAARVAERAALRELELPTAVASLGARLAAAQQAAADAAAALTAARSARDEAQEALDQGADAGSVERSLERLDRRARLAASVAELAPQQADAAQRAGDAASAEDEAQGRLQVADEVLAAAKEAAGASALVAALVTGQPCPVCRQVVHDLPAHDLDAELAAATAVRRAAATDQAEAAAARTAADRDHDRLVADLRGRTEELDALAEAVAPGTDADALRAQLAAAHERKDRCQAAVAAATAAEQASTAAMAEVDARRAQERDLRHAYTEARDSVAVRRPPPPSGSSLLDDWTDLVTWAADQAAPLQAEVGEAQANEAAATLALEGEQAAVAAACAPYAIDPSVRGLGERIATAAAQAEHDHADAQRQRSERAELEAQVAALEERRAVHAAMGLHLSVSGFERWLLQEALDDLVARATERLYELSGGQFSLGSDDGDFWIRDHRNADERRDVRTLSGGETFLAALALALALADNVAELAVEGGPRLESMFLDEGFGTLDPETLDIVATAMEELSASGRLIGIVTHIRDLADRMPVRFEVHRDATTARVALVEL